MELDPEETDLATRAVHAGEEAVRPNREVTTPVSLTSTYQFESMEEVKEYISGKKPHFEYGRYGNPTRQVAAEKLQDLEGAASCLMTASGMNAVTTTLLTLLSEGDHVVATRDIYKKTLYFLKYDLDRFGVDATFADPGDPEAIEEAVREETRVLFFESPTNPFLNVVDLPALVDLAETHDLKTVVDATFATPYNQRPLEMGVDLVIQSNTKYLGGHNDLIGGAVLGSFPQVEQIREMHNTLGGVVDAHTCYLLIRGLKTFPLRMERLNASALKVARDLEGHPSVERVYYPGLESHPQHEIARDQMEGYGAVISFEIEGGLEEATTFLDGLQYPKIAPSLGGVETLITHPATVSYYDFSDEELDRLGITDSLIRLSVGLEDPEDLSRDLLGSLDVISE